MISFSSAAKILIYTPNISPSHIVMSGRMADVLIKAGHDVVLFIPEYDPSVTLNGTKNAKIWRMSNISDAFIRGMNDFGSGLFTEPYGGFVARKAFETALGEMCEDLMSRQKDFEQIKNYNFDIVITEMIDLCGLGIMRYLGIKNHIWHSTTPLHDNVAYNLGVPNPASYIPSTEENLIGPKMTFFEKAFNFYMHFITLYIHHYATDRATEAIQKYAGPNFPNVRQIASESALAVINSDEFLDIARPVLHKTVYIGGLGIGDPKPVEEEPFKSFISQSKKGVIVFSLGTIAPTTMMTLKVKENLIKTFTEFEDYNFIMKIDKDDKEMIDLCTKAKNILITTWMPQSDILGHPKIKFFIMHGGFNGLLESAIRGCPVIVIPIFADQQRNAKMAEYRGFGIVVEKTNLEGSALKSAIQTILNNPNFSQKAKRISKLIKSKPFKADEVFVKWIEFVVENGNLPELTPEGANMGWIEYFCLDVIFVGYLAGLFILLFIAYFVKKILFLCINSVKVKNE
uniref:glucuronosyltransferase n=1 Tax=Panagrolaimus davidi TaxID=227884 RepID=A0A914Q412_9BILA